MNSLTHVFDGGSGRPISGTAVKVARFLMGHPNMIHSRDVLATAAGFAANGRSCDTLVSSIRKALGNKRRIVSSHGAGYGWVGDPIDIIPCVKPAVRKPQFSVQFAVMPQDEVAKRLGISVGEVKRREATALSKLRRHPEILRLWTQLQRHFERMQYDPFHKIWLFAVSPRSPRDTLA